MINLEKMRIKLMIKIFRLYLFFICMDKVQYTINILEFLFLFLEIFELECDRILFDNQSN